MFAKFRECSPNVPAAMTYEEMYNIEGDEPSTEPPNVESIGGGGSTDPLASPMGTSQPRSDSVDSNVQGQPPPHRRGNTPSSSRQRSMEDAMAFATRQSLDKKWASFFYEANIPFNVVRHPAFVSAVQETAKSGLVYQPPSYNAMRTTLIEAKKVVVEEMVESQTKDSIEQYGCTICSDGWSDTNSRPLMNVMLVCPAGDVFLGSIDTTGKKKCSQFTADSIASYIEEVGPQNVVQVCTDNAASMLGALRILEDRYPHVYRQGCAAHILDLLLEDWGKEPWVKELVYRAKRICKFIRAYHAPMALLRKYSPNLALKTPPSTRFAVNFLMVERLIKLKQVLNNVVLDPAWDEFVASIFHRQNSHRAYLYAGLVRKDIRLDSFWKKCELFVQVVEPVIVALRVFDGSVPSMPRAWLTMTNLKKHVYSLREEPFFLEETTATKYERAFENRWKMMLTDLHYAAALLNPYMKGVREIHDSGKAKQALISVLQKLSGPLGVSYEEAMEDYMQFKDKTGPFNLTSGAPVVATSKLLPHQWWNCAPANALPIIARRILSLTCSASSCERNWSMYSFVHNKVRNRLATKKAETLVYIYTNSKLQREKRGETPAAWYSKNVLHEEDSDMENQEVVALLDESEDEDAPYDADYAMEVDSEGTSPPPRRYGNTFVDENVEDAFAFVDEEEYHVDVQGWNHNEDASDNANLPRENPLENPTTEDVVEATNAVTVATNMSRQLVNPPPNAMPIPTIPSHSAARDFTMEDGNDSDVPLGALYPSIAAAATSHPSNPPSSVAPTVGSLATCVRSTPSSRGITLARLSGLRKGMTQGADASTPQSTPLARTSSMEVGIGNSAPPCTQPSPITQDAGPSSQPRNRITRGQKRARMLETRTSRKALRSGSGTFHEKEVGRHPSMTGDGITDVTRPTKRLVLTQQGASQSMEIRNLTSEVEGEVQLVDNESDEDKSTEESMYGSDSQADEAPSDDTFTP